MLYVSYISVFKKNLKRATKKSKGRHRWIFCHIPKLKSLIWHFEMTIIKKHYTFKSIDTRKRLITLLSLECQCYLWVCCKILICKGIFFVIQLLNCLRIIWKKELKVWGKHSYIIFKWLNNLLDDLLPLNSSWFQFFKMEKPKVQKNGEGLSRCSGEGFQILGLDRCHQNVLQCNSLYFMLSCILLVKLLS